MCNSYRQLELGSKTLKGFLNTTENLVPISSKNISLVLNELKKTVLMMKLNFDYKNCNVLNKLNKFKICWEKRP